MSLVAFSINTLVDFCMFLSVIIPVYNVEPYLRECLDSVFAQDLTDCEVIAVNDGSTDGSRAILAEYAERYPELMRVVDKDNGGLSSARNAGVAQAQGNWLYFVDSDDWLRPHALESIRQAIGVSVGADVVYMDCIVTDRGKRWKEHKEKNIPLMDFRSFFKYAYKHKIGLTSNAFSYIYSNAYWRKVGLHYEEGIKYEDALFKSQLFVREDGTVKAVHVEAPFYVFRVGREGSLSTELTLKNFTDRQLIRKKADKLWRELGIDDTAYYHMLFESCAFMSYEALKCGLIKDYRRFWDRDDVRIMRKGVSNEREYGFWLLAKMSPKWMARYYANDLPSWKRRLTNIILTCCGVFYR